MIIEIGTKMLIHNANRGEFYAKARRTFSLEDEVYPVIITDPLDSTAVKNQEADLRGAVTEVELMELEVEPEIENEIQDNTETEIEIEVEEGLPPEACVENESSDNGIASFRFHR